MCIRDRSVVVILEREVDGTVVGGNEVAHHLEPERGLAQTLGSAQQYQLTRAETAGERLVQGAESGRPHLGSCDLTCLEPVVGLFQEAVQGLQPPRPRRCLLYTSPSPRDRTRPRMPSS